MSELLNLVSETSNVAVFLEAIDAVYLLLGFALLFVLSLLKLSNELGLLLELLLKVPDLSVLCS